MTPKKIHRYMGYNMNYLQEDLAILAEYIKGFEGSTVLVTGATGLIGSLCIKAMQQNGSISVIGLARNQDKVNMLFENKDNTMFLYQDIKDPIPDTVRCDYIIHTANSTTSQYFLSNPVEVIDSIYTGTKQVLEYARKQKVKGMVYHSSMEVFGVVNSNSRVHEDELGKLDIQNVRSCYSEGKRLVELLCKSYSEEYKVPVRTARLAQTFGAGVQKTENRVFAQFARSAIKGENIVLHTTGRSVGNYCYTRDVIKAIFLLLTTGKKGDAYTVVNEETTRTIAEMAEIVAKEFSGGRSQVIFDIPQSNQYGYAPDTQLRLSSEKLRLLGWMPEVDLKEMYERMIPSLMN